RARDVERVLGRRALLLDLGAALLQGADPPLRLGKAGLQRVELEQRTLRMGAQAFVRGAQAGDAVTDRGVFGARPRRGDEESDGGRTENREPSRTHLASRPHEPSTLTRGLGTLMHSRTGVFAPRREALLPSPACDCGATPSLRLRLPLLGGSYPTDSKTFVL